MLVRYRFDLTSASAEDREHIVALLNNCSFTGVKCETPTVFSCFFEEEDSVDELVPLPDGCSKTRS